MRLLTILVKLLLETTTKTNYADTQNIFTHMMWDQHIQQQMQQQMHQDMETARMAATGIEFGGFNPDPALNPGMMTSMMDSGMF